MADRLRPATLQAAVRDAAAAATVASHGTDASATVRRRTWLVPIAILGSVLATVVAIWFMVDGAAPDSEVARRLLVVAQGVDAHRERTGEWPERLSQMPGFPADAVEWEMEDYSVRLAAPQLEFFYFEASDGYIVIARFDDEVWVYDSAESRPLRRVPVR